MISYHERENMLFKFSTLFHQNEAFQTANSIFFCLFQEISSLLFFLSLKNHFGKNLFDNSIIRRSGNIIIIIEETCDST